MVWERTIVGERLKHELAADTSLMCFVFHNALLGADVSVVGEQKRQDILFLRQMCNSYLSHRDHKQAYCHLLSIHAKEVS